MRQALKVVEKESHGESKRKKSQMYMSRKGGSNIDKGVADQVEESYESLLGLKRAKMEQFKKELDTKDVGYQAPVDESLVTEYDPEQITRVPHREFLKENVAFKEVVPIKDEAIRQKIHQTCRLGYLKDVILPRVLDDSAFGMLTSMMMCNNVDVVQALHRDPEFFAELFNRLKSSKPGDKDWNDLIGFLQELCTLAHAQQCPL